MPVYEVTVKAQATFTYVVEAGNEVEAGRLALDGNTYEEPEYVLENKHLLSVEEV